MYAIQIGLFYGVIVTENLKVDVLATAELRTFPTNTEVADKT